MSELYIKRLKNKLKKMDKAMESVDMLTQEQQSIVLGTIDEGLDKLSLLKDAEINKSIEDFDRENDSIDTEILRLDTIMQEQYKKKMELYKKTYNDLIKNL